MNKSNVKPQAGQIWKSTSHEISKYWLNVKVVLIKRGGDLVEYRGMGSSVTDTTEDFCNYYEFEPQTDLEWLAVNCDECPKSVKGNFYLCKDYNQVAVSNKHGYHREQWQNMRFELGLDDKPQSDLEWLAVKVTEWTVDARCVFRSPATKSGYYFFDSDVMASKYTIEQLNEAKRELGLDELPVSQDAQAFKRLGAAVNNLPNANAAANNLAKAFALSPQARPMKAFTLENTKDATHYARNLSQFGPAINFYKLSGTLIYLMNFATKYKWKAVDDPYFELIELSRDINHIELASGSSISYSQNMPHSIHIQSKEDKPSVEQAKQKSTTPEIDFFNDLFSGFFITCDDQAKEKLTTTEIDLSNAQVGDEFVLNNGSIVSFFARTKMNSICQLTSGHAMLYHHNGKFDESVEIGDNGQNWDIVSKREPELMSTEKTFSILDEEIGEVKASTQLSELKAVYETPVFTPSSNDLELQRLADFVCLNKLINDGENPVDCVIRELAEKHDIDLRSNEDKLRDEITSMIEDMSKRNICYAAGAFTIACQLMASDKFEIKLKG